MNEFADVCAERDKLLNQITQYDDNRLKLEAQLKKNDEICAAQNAKQNTEIDRLKAALALWEGAHGLDRERDLWKSKAEIAERRVSKLAEALRFCVGWMEPVLGGFVIDRKAESYRRLVEAKAALAEFEEDK